MLEVIVNQNQYPNIDRYAQKNRQDQELEAMGIDSSEVDFNAPQTYQEFLNQNPAKGTLKIQAFTARQAAARAGRSCDRQQAHWRRKSCFL